MICAKNVDADLTAATGKSVVTRPNMGMNIITMANPGITTTKAIPSGR